MKKGRNEKRFLKKMSVLVMALLVVATSIGVYPQEVAAAKTPKNGIVFEQSKATLYAGEYTTIVPKEVYQNGKRMSWATPGKPLDKKEFNYKSSNTKVATVNSKGVVTAKKKGTATITVTSIYNKKVKGSFKLTVSKGTQKAKITLKKTKATIAVGKSTTISVKSTKGLSAKTVKYTSSNTKVAAVNSKGKVAGKKAGTATITVTSGVNKKVTAKFKVTVKTPDIIDTDYSPKGKAKIVLQETKVTLAPESTFDVWYPENGGKIVTSKFASDPGFGEYVTPSKILVANKKKYGTAQIKIKSMTGLKSTAVTYKSSNTKVAVVDSMGKVTPKRAGTAVITVTSKANKKVTATYKVTVKNLVTSFEFAQYTNLKKQDPWYDTLGETYISDMYDWREVMVYPIPENADNRGYTLTSSDESVVKIYKEQVAGVGYGTATLTLKSADGFCKYSWKCTVSDKGTTCWGNVDFGD